MKNLLIDYLPILLFIGIGIALGVLPLLASWFLAPQKPDNEKLSSYECGFEPFDSSRTPFDIKFYLIALLFIIFDLETALLFPWAVEIRALGWSGFFAVVIFLAILVVGFSYEWKRGALEWE